MLGERLIDAREAALALNLPHYWLTHAKERRRLRLPHYRVGKLLRFKLSELMACKNKFLKSFICPKTFRFSFHQLLGLMFKNYVI